MIQNQNSVHLQEYLKVLRTRFWVIFTIFILTVLSGFYMTEEVLPKVYSASTEIEVKPRGNVDLQTFDRQDTDRPFDPTTFQAEYEILQSSAVLDPVIEKLGLEKKWAKTIFKSPLDKITPQQALAYMGHIVKVEFKRGTDIIVISVDSEDPKEAAQIANEVANSYKQMRDDEETSRTGRGVDETRKQMEEEQKIVDDRRTIVDGLRKQADAQHISIDPTDHGEQSRDDADLTRLKNDLLIAKEDADGRRVLMQNVDNLPDSEFVDTLSAMGRAEKDIQDIRTDIFKNQSSIDNLLKQGFGEENPHILALRAEIATEQQQVTDLVKGQRREIEVDVQMASSRVALIEGEVKDLTAKTAQEQTSVLQPFRDAEEEYQRQVSILAAYNVRLQQDIGDITVMQSPVKIISPAEPPEIPSKPNKTLDMLVSGLAGLILGVAVAFLVEYLDTSVKTMADAELLLGLPVLTVIPSRGGPMLLTSQAARSPHAEGYRILRAKLDLKVQNGLGPSLSVLSGGPGEGKSTTIYNMAIICAQAGQSVILVDCDLRRPSVHDMARVPNDRGMANYLRGEGDALDYIQRTELPNMHVLTGGEMAMADIGTLVSGKIRALLDELKQRYDVVLVDSPPILGISDGSIIAREVDYVILVIQHRRYPREVSLRAKRAIQEVNGNCVGIVLNCVAVKSDDSYYYYSNYGNDKKKGSRKGKRKHSTAVKSNGKPVLVATRKESLESEDF